MFIKLINYLNIIDILISIRPRNLNKLYNELYFIHHKKVAPQKTKFHNHILKIRFFKKKN